MRINVGEGILEGDVEAAPGSAGLELRPDVKVACRDKRSAIGVTFNQEVRVGKSSADFLDRVLDIRLHALRVVVGSHAVEGIAVLEDNFLVIAHHGAKVAIGLLTMQDKVDLDLHVLRDGGLLDLETILPALGEMNVLLVDLHRDARTAAGEYATILKVDNLIVGNGGVVGGLKVAEEQGVIRQAEEALQGVPGLLARNRDLRKVVADERQLGAIRARGLRSRLTARDEPEHIPLRQIHQRSVVENDVIRAAVVANEHPVVRNASLIHHVSGDTATPRKRNQLILKESSPLWRGAAVLRMFRHGGAVARFGLVNFGHC